jgi:type II secretory pathway pseudopilin PulG
MSSTSSRSFHKNSPRRTAFVGGFGMIELMVTVSIMMVISSVIMLKQTSFNGTTLLRSQVYDVALSIRELQLSVVSAESNGSDNFRSVQGAYFSTNNSTTYRIYKDADNDKYYDSTEEYGKQGTLDNRFEIRAIRVGGTSASQVAIVFVRPNFDAKFYTDSSGTPSSASNVEIDIGRKGMTTAVCGTDFRTVEITRTGQIAIKDCP